MNKKEYPFILDDIQNLSQAVRDLDGINLPQAVREILWGHNTELIFKLKEPVKRLRYARMALEHGWSRNILIHQIGTNLYSRQGKAITNFAKTLPAPQPDLANQLLKDPYHLDFPAVGQDVTERQLEMALLEGLKVFILELGKGFAFVGHQVYLEVGGKDYYFSYTIYSPRLTVVTSCHFSCT